MWEMGVCRQIPRSGLDAYVPPGGSKMPKRTREVDALLYQQNDRCYVCDTRFEEDTPLETDHKTRLADGGTDELSNKCVVCKPCHVAKTTRENAMTPCFEYTPDNINEFIRGKQSGVPKQTHQRYSIQQLRGWWLDGGLRRASCNRDAVWPTNKRQAFLQTLFGGGITPPIFLNDLRTQGGVKEIYDGVNRLATIMEFMDGKSHITYQKGRTTISATFGCCKANHGCLKRCVALDAVNRRMFESIMIDTFLWDNLSTAEACDVAQHLNEGTAMTMGEKLRLLCGLGTHRARSSTSTKRTRSRPSSRRIERERKTLLSSFATSPRQTACSPPLSPPTSDRSRTSTAARSPLKSGRCGARRTSSTGRMHF